MLRDYENDPRFTVVKPNAAIKLYQDDVLVLVPAVGTKVSTKDFGDLVVLGYVAVGRTDPKATWSAYVTSNENADGSFVTLRCVRVN